MPSKLHVKNSFACKRIRSLEMGLNQEKQKSLASRVSIDDDKSQDVAVDLVVVSWLANCSAWSPKRHCQSRFSCLRDGNAPDSVARNCRSKRRSFIWMTWGMGATGGTLASCGFTPWQTPSSHDVIKGKSRVPVGEVGAISQRPRGVAGYDETESKPVSWFPLESARVGESLFSLGVAHPKTSTKWTKTSKTRSFINLIPRCLEILQ